MSTCTALKSHWVVSFREKTLSSGTADAIDLGRVNGQSCMRLYSKCIA